MYQNQFFISRLFIFCTSSESLQVGQSSNRFEHFCTAYDKLNKADKDIRQNNDMKKLLMDMRLIDSEMEFNKILEDDNVKNQIYGYIEKVGGIDRARQSIRQPAPQQV